MNKNTYKNEYNKIKLTDIRKHTLITKMQEAEKVVYAVEKESYRQSSMLLRAVAACLTVAVLVGGTYFGSKFSNSVDTTLKNSFILTADAAEGATLPEDAICMFSGKSEGGFINDDVYSVGYTLSGLAVKGTNIDKITMTSNKKFCYFSISNKADLNYFSDYDTLNNSQIYMEELTSEMNGYRCDGFTYQNIPEDNSEQIIQLDTLVDFVLESDKTDEEIADWISEMDSLNRQQWEIRAEQHAVYGDNVAIPVSKEEQELSDEYDICLRKFAEKTLRDATITVTVTFTDGTMQTQNLDVDFILNDFDGNIVFDPRVDEYSEEIFTDKDAYEWIAIRYSRDGNELKL